MQSNAYFTVNEGQWNDEIQFQLESSGGNVYLKKQGVKFYVFNRLVYGDYKHGRTEKNFTPAHVYDVDFLNANPDVRLIGDSAKNHYKNFILGNDANKWKSDVKNYGNVTYLNLYDNIDVQYYGYYDQLKYDIIVHPFGNPNDILMQYSGIEDVKLVKGHLVIESNAGRIIEQKPYAYQIIDGKEVEVPCEYIWEDNKLSFLFKEEYDASLNLIIDPILTFSTFTGSTADNFGCTATYDSQGNLYAGGTVFSVGYPTTTGAFNQNFNGLAGNADFGITKFSADGTSLFYSTYIGGTAEDAPQSMICNSQDELCILGHTGSSDFPVTATAYDGSFQPGGSINLGSLGLTHLNGTDIVVVKLNSAGSALAGSTYFGGSDIDGVNSSAALRNNYGDELRGEIVVDASDNIIIGSSTKSLDYPTLNAFSNTYSGGDSDGCVAVFNSDLSSLLFSTYFGGQADDAIFSIQLNSAGNFGITGGTNSNDLPTSGGALNANIQGGKDGFVAILSSDLSTVNACTYLGTINDELSFFVQFDNDDNVYVFGQTEGPFYPVTGSVYFEVNGRHFIHKLNPNLSSTVISTVIGANGYVNISPTAFLVSECGQIYISGWGGSIAPSVDGINEDTFGMTVTPNAVLPTATGNDMYLAVYDPDCSSLVYATYMGGVAGSGRMHVDGGTSRFSKDGTIYQAVCAGCGGTQNFITTPNVWSPTNNSTNCNLGAFKFELAVLNTVIQLPQYYVCLPSNNFTFSAVSNYGNAYSWDFGDGDTSNLFTPVHNYQDTGVYEVTLIVSDTIGCYANDTAVFDINVYQNFNAVAPTVAPICSGDSVQLEASGGLTYSWIPATGLSNPNIYNPMASPAVTTNYMILAEDSCSIDTAYLLVEVFQDSLVMPPDQVLCIGSSVQLTATGGADYNWTPSATLNDPTVNNPMATPSSSTTYYLEALSPNGCLLNDSVSIVVDFNAPVPDVTPDTIICKGDNIQLYANGGDDYNWYPSAHVSNPFSAITNTTINSSQVIYVDITNSCATVTDSVFVTVVEIFPSISPDTTICPGDTARLEAGGGVNYSWSPASTLSHPDSVVTFSTPDVLTNYTVVIEDAFGCEATQAVEVDIYPLPEIVLIDEIYLQYGMEVNLVAATNGVYGEWSTADSTLCINCESTVVGPLSDQWFTYYTEDLNGCENTDSVLVIISGDLYLPNSFTPNGDGYNDYFIPKSVGITDFKMYIFNRWGQLIFEADEVTDYWDGTFKGDIVQQDVYIWKIEYKDKHQKRYKKTGHVSVIR